VHVEQLRSAVSQNALRFASFAHSTKRVQAIWAEDTRRTILKNPCRRSKDAFIGRLRPSAPSLYWSLRGGYLRTLRQYAKLRPETPIQ